MSISLGLYIKNLRKQQSLTQNELATSVGVSAVSIHKWESGQAAPKEEYLPALATALSCDEAKIKQLCQQQNSHKETKLPIVPVEGISTWMQAPSKVSIDEYYIDDSSPWATFAFYMKTDVMASPGGRTIPQGSVCLCETSRKATSGNIVIVSAPSQSSVTIRELIIDGPHRYLKALNDNYPTIDFPENGEVVAIVRKVIIDMGEVFTVEYEGGDVDSFTDNVILKAKALLASGKSQ